MDTSPRMQKVIALAIALVLVAGCQNQEASRTPGKVTYFWQPRHVIARTDYLGGGGLLFEEPSQIPEMVVYSDGTIVRTDRGGAKTGRISHEKICEFLVEAQKAGFYAFDNEEYKRRVRGVYFEDAIRLEVNGWQSRIAVLGGLRMFDKAGRQLPCPECQVHAAGPFYTATIPPGPSETYSLLKELSTYANEPYQSDRVVMRITSGYDNITQVPLDWPAELPKLDTICEDPRVGLRIQYLQSVNCVAGIVLPLSQISRLIADDKLRNQDGVFVKEAGIIYLVNARYALPHELTSSAGELVATISDEPDTSMVDPTTCVDAR